MAESVEQETEERLHHSKDTRKEAVAKCVSVSFVRWQVTEDEETASGCTWEI